jgi:hypothetical protein
MARKVKVTIISSHRPQRDCPRCKSGRTLCGQFYDRMAFRCMDDGYTWRARPKKNEFATAK